MPAVPQTPQVPQTPAQPGANTPPENLLAALKEEREAKAALEERLRIAEETIAGGVHPNPGVEPFSDEGKMIIKEHVKPLADTVTRLTGELAMKDLVIKHPVLLEKQEEFQEFRNKRPGYLLEDVAQLFLQENGLLPAPVRRPGLESPTAGPRLAAPTGAMTTEDIAYLRKTNYREYTKRLQNGEITISGNE